MQDTAMLFAPATAASAVFLYCFTEIGLLIIKYKYMWMKMMGNWDKPESPQCVARGWQHGKQTHTLEWPARTHQDCKCRL